MSTWNERAERREEFERDLAQHHLDKLAQKEATITKLDARMDLLDNVIDTTKSRAELAALRAVGGVSAPRGAAEMKSKYNARRTTVDGIAFDSKAEAQAYTNRMLLQRNGDISGLVLQPRYRLEVNGVHVCDYIADFRYTVTATGTEVVEDVKGVKTPVYQIKKKLLKALYGISVLESGKDEIPF